MKITRIILSALAVAMLAGTLPAHGQEKQARGKAPSVRPAAVRAQFYMQRLRVDSATASAVAKIQSDYKSGMAALMRDTSLTEEGRRSGIRALMAAKNAKLGKVLSPLQQDKIIPSTERTLRPATGAIADTASRRGAHRP